MLSAIAPYSNEGKICCLSVELCYKEFFVCVQLNTPLSNHRNKVYEYGNKPTFEVIYKIFENFKLL